MHDFIACSGRLYMQCECEATRTRSILNFLESWDNAIDDKSARTGLASSL